MIANVLHGLREMKRALTLANSDTKLLAKHLYAAVVWHFEVINTGHYGGEVVVGCVRWLARFADNGEHGSESSEACLYISLCRRPADKDNIGTYHQ